MTRSPEPVLCGSQTPRVRSVPPYVSSSGPEAVAIARKAGLVLDPWQQMILTDALGERPNGRWSAFETAVWVPRQNGKGALIEARVLAGLFLFGERLILWSAHEYKTAQEGFLRIKELIQSTPSLDKRVARYWQANGEQGIELKTGQRLRFVARSKGSGRGFSGDLVILDEAQYLTAAQMRALFPTMAARPNPQVWYLGTPPDDDAAWVYGVRKDGEAGKARLAYFDWGQDLDLSADDLLERLADRDLWYAANPGLGRRPGFDEEFIEDELSRLEEDFAPERLGVWLPPADLANQWEVIPEKNWEDLKSPTSELCDPVSFGIAVSPDRSVTAIAAAGRRPDGQMHVEVIEQRAGVSWAVERMVELDRKWEPLATAVDEHGPGASLIDKLRDEGVMVTAMTTGEVAKAYVAFYDGVMDTRSVRHRGQKYLDDALAGAAKRDIGDGMSAWGRRSSSVPIVALEAATNALWAHEFAAIVIDGSLMA